MDNNLQFPPGLTGLTAIITFPGLVVAVLDDACVSTGFTTAHLSSVSAAALHSAPRRIPVRSIFDGS